MQRLGICLLLFILFPGCKKENHSTHVAIEINYLNGSRAIEWQHIEGSYVKEDGKITIHAEGAADENFKLELLQVMDTVSFQNLGLHQMYFTDDALFMPLSLSGSSVNIEKLDIRLIRGRFKGNFSSASEIKEIEGRFAMHISE